MPTFAYTSFSKEKKSQLGMKIGAVGIFLLGQSQCIVH